MFSGSQEEYQNVKSYRTDDGRTEGRRTQCEGRGGGGFPTTGTPLD